MRHNFSKSKYCKAWQCPKILWLDHYEPQQNQVDASVDSRMEAGTEVGKLARDLFGDSVDVTAKDGESLCLLQMIEKTKREIARGTDVICEASFSYDKCYCAVDILKREENGWAIYEVKSSTADTEHMPQVYIADVAYQKYVLEHCGITVVGTYIVSINSDYVYDGTLKLKELFRITDVKDLVLEEVKNVQKNLEQWDEILRLETEPEIDLGEYCRAPYECQYWDKCSKHLSNPSVFDLYRMPFKKKLEYYKDGFMEFEALKKSKLLTNAKQLRQIEFALGDKGTYIDIPKIWEFLDTLSYPLYFLDFETMQPVLPVFSGTKPYQQIPFQYSLHYIEYEGGVLQHKEFLAESGENPMRAIAESLCNDIPMDVCVTAYNKAFECSRIKELAELFPDLSVHLLNIRDNIKDLLDPFQKGYYYNRAMGGSFSIKSVLPAIFPDDPKLDYHNLEGVHNGSEAMTLFPKIKDMPEEEQKEARRNLLKYCELDTYAMVKVWEELVRVGGEGMSERWTYDELVKGFKDVIRKEFKETMSMNSEDAQEDIYVEALYQGYLDACRTFKWEKKDETERKKSIKNSFEKSVAKEIKDFLQGEKELDHGTMCDSLKEIFEDMGVTNMSYGKSQKIINMAFKYLYCCEHDEKMDEQFKKCHMPLDSFSLEWFKRKFKEEDFTSLKEKDENYGDLFKKKNKGLILKFDAVGSWSSMKSRREDLNKYYPYEFYSEKINDYCQHNDITPLELDFVVWPKMQKIMAADAFIKAFRDENLEKNDNQENYEDPKAYDINNLEKTCEARINIIQGIINNKESDGKKNS